jgi:large subunit ribosomal protein L41
MPIDKRGVRDSGVIVRGKFKSVPELIPELIVPDLTDCKFKPYVTYKTPEVVQSKFMAQDLYNAVYAQKVIDDFKQDKLNEDGSSKDPSGEELLTPEEAFNRARKTGSDIF